MLGLMQDWPLLCHRIIEHAAAVHGTQEVVTRSVEGPIHRTNYAEIRDRALKVSQRLDRDGIKIGDRVATIAWNTWRHLEAWYGIMGIGAICHTINPRLFPDQIAWNGYYLCADPGKNRRQAAQRGTLHRAHRRCAHAENHAEERGRL